MQIETLFPLPEGVYKSYREGEKVKPVLRDARMRQEHGHGPAGLTCGTCALFVRGTKEVTRLMVTKTVQTGGCQMYKGGPSVAWKPDAQACSLWEGKEEG